MGPLIFLIAASSINLAHSSTVSPDWDALSATFQIFSTLPTSEAEAVKTGWVKDAKCNEFSYFRGIRYILNNDKGLMLLFDMHGNIAGLQTSFKRNELLIRPKIPFAEDKDDLFLTVYFDDPEKICNTPSPRSSSIIGTAFYFQEGNNPRNFISVPFEEAYLNSKVWIQGKCLAAMGMHYWHGISSKMSCDDQYPLFLLYTGGKLRAFGWAVNADLKSMRYEHPPPITYPLFFKPESQPICLDTTGPISTLHIYLNKIPSSISC